MKTFKALDKSVANFREVIFRRGAERIARAVKRVGYKWESFGEIAGDKAKRVDTDDPENYCLIYKTENKGEFDARYHDEIESGICLSGKVILKTADGDREIKAGETWELDAGAWHKLSFIQEAKIMMNFIKN